MGEAFLLDNHHQVYIKEDICIDQKDGMKMPPATEYPIIIPNGLEWGVTKMRIYAAGADAMHKANVEFLKEHNISKGDSCIVISDDSWLELQGKL